MEDCSLPLGRLGEKALRRLAEMLDNPTCGWRRLATAVSEEPRLCSSKELESCSLQVLSSNGSPSRYLLSQLSDRACSVGYLLQSLKKIDHKEAVQYLTAAEHQGHYICRIHLGEQFVFSQWAQVRVSRSSSLSSVSGLFPSAVSRLQILSQPRPLALGEGDPLSLECVAEGNPPPQYQWYRNKQPLPQAHRACLQISCVTTVDRGQYSCRVYNSYQELWSKQVHVEIAAKGKGKGMAKDAQKGPEVCKDPVKLTTHAMGVNIYKEGQDPPLQAASEYPEWLFQLDLGPPKQLSELDPESREYWKLMRKEHMWRFNKLHKGKKL
ncbi:39S ribosomal protein L54, mitochondrial [Acipenser ruthenus]|uniref:Large ribosomal subunit protein mL54 n=1 Tax=Acipenser ruthenus TaxID=7906 RepID=A0A444V3I1_ACIRT|nr:39S ribosomal protein L54, mitochondrial [Acipenser ruthenus]